MSILSEKYGIPEEKIKMLVKDGYINCSALQYEEIVYYYKSEVNKGVASTQAVYNTSEKFGYKERRVWEIIARFK